MISNYLKEYFSKNKISQYEVERRTGISQSKINLSLNNKRKLSADELIEIAIEFDLDLNKIKEIKQCTNLIP
ncbi:MAG: helix-turn-helix transcriptional regulator [Firmicutes bacterium]|nr:helix-turn-helix transcriptional regulator [Bacillota bacterium]